MFRGTVIKEHSNSDTTSTQVELEPAQGVCSKKQKTDEQPTTPPTPVTFVMLAAPASPHETLDKRRHKVLESGVPSLSALLLAASYKCVSGEDMTVTGVETGVLQNLPVKDIRLDHANPRIRKFLEMYGEEPTPEQVYLALGAAGDDENESSASFEKLKNSILTNGSIIQPIIVNRETTGALVCIEGNTRLALYKSFVEDKVKGNWSSIPSLVYEAMDQAKIDAIRLQVHLVGVRPWDPYSKAKYLHYLRTQELLPFATIIDYCGGRAKEITISIDAFNDMEKYYRPIIPDDGTFDTSRFSGFVELQKPTIKEAILEAGFTFTDFAHWVHDEKLYPLQSVRQLPRILRNPKAKELFLKQGAKAAMPLLDRPELGKALGDATLAQLAHALAQKVYGLNFLEAERIRTDSNSEEAQALSETITAVNLLLGNGNEA
jgi:hypothetical protein